jgi:hypothetical protein
MRTKYEQEVSQKTTTSDSILSVNAKQPSKWDKPKSPTPPPINRIDDETDSVFSEIRQEELPPSQMTRSLVTRFKSFEEGEEEAFMERKPLRKMTPPRDEMEASLAAYRQSIKEKQIVRDPGIIVSGTKDEDEQERPPAKFTKNMTTQFQSLELEGAPPPSPLRSEQVAALARQTSVTKSNRQSVSQIHASAMTDSGIGIEGRGEISVNEPIPSLCHEEIIEGGIFENEPITSHGVVRESDNPNEEELPESGSARNLLAQWRNVETSTSYIPTDFSKAPNNNFGSRITHECRMGSNMQLNEFGEVVRESDQNEAQFLPPAGLSKNLTAKFKTIEEQHREMGSIIPFDYSLQASRNSSSSRYTHECRVGMMAQTAEGLEVVRESDQNEEEYLPPPGLSKGLMTKFRSMEEEYKDIGTLPVDYSNTSSSRHASNARFTHECRMGSISGDAELEVVRESDQNEEGFLPPAGLSKNLSAKFASLEERNRELAASSTSSLNRKVTSCLRLSKTKILVTSYLGNDRQADPQ